LKWKAKTKQKKLTGTLRKASKQWEQAYLNGRLIT